MERLAWGTWMSCSYGLGNPPVTYGLPYKVPAMQKVFTCHGIIMHMYITNNKHLCTCNIYLLYKSRDFFNMKSIHVIILFTIPSPPTKYPWHLGPFQCKDSLSRSRDSHYQNKAVIRWSYLYDGNSYTGKTAFILKQIYKVVNGISEPGACFTKYKCTF